MNERIRQLAEQAGSTHKQNLGVYQFYTDELEKFALLIVQGNIQTLRSHGHDLAAQVLQDIHFGIEDPV